MPPRVGDALVRCGEGAGLRCLPGCVRALSLQRRRCATRAHSRRTVRRCRRQDRPARVLRRRPDPTQLAQYREGHRTARRGRHRAHSAAPRNVPLRHVLAYGRLARPPGLRRHERVDARHHGVLSQREVVRPDHQRGPCRRGGGGQAAAGHARRQPDRELPARHRAGATHRPRPAIAAAGAEADAATRVVDAGRVMDAGPACRPVQRVNRGVHPGCAAHQRGHRRAGRPQGPPDRPDDLDARRAQAARR